MSKLIRNSEQNKQEKIKAEVDSNDELSYQTNSKFSGEVFKQKAVQEAKTLLEEQGFQVSDNSSKLMTNAVNASITSSVVLFEKNAGSESMGRSKKRYVKAADKDDMKSVKSGKTSKSFGGDMGKPGSEFQINGIQFTVLDEKDTRNNRIVVCQCKTKIRRDKAKRHTEHKSH